MPALVPDFSLTSTGVLIGGAVIDGDNSSSLVTQVGNLREPSENKTQVNNLRY
jgi:sucrose-6-phosphate hydrolase SacC (GH32 family)